MAYHYSATVEERIETGFLLNSPSSNVSEWLKSNFSEPRKGIYGESLDLYRDDGRRLIEFLLVKRNDRLIDHSIARYGYSIYSIQKAFDRGDVSTRLAALSNIRGGLRLRGSTDILKSGDLREIRMILCNRWLGSEKLIKILSREEEFSDIDEVQFSKILTALRDNKRLQEPYNSLTLDGYDDFRYNKVFQVAWALTSTVPANEEWASILWDFLGRVVRLGRPDNFESVLDRWQIDEDKDGLPKKWFERSCSFNLRVLLYDFLKADESLLRSDDRAARISFYKRFSPTFFKNWPNFLEIDGEEFTYASLDNLNLWRSSEERERLSKVCWDTPDPKSNMDMPNDYRWKEDDLRGKHPEWFVEDNRDEDPLRSIFAKLECIDEALEKLSITPDKKTDYGFDNINKALENLSLTYQGSEDSLRGINERLKRIEGGLERISSKRGLFF